MNSLRLKIYNILQNLANSSYNPFITFLAVVLGFPSILLGVLSSATTSFTNLSSFILSFFKVQPKFVLVVGNLILSTSLFALSFSLSNPIIFTVLYVIISISLGISTYAWLLIIEELSRGGNRGSKVAEFSLYSTLGSLIASLTVGFIISEELDVIKLIFISCAFLILINTVQISTINLRYNDIQISKLNKRLIKFYIDNFIFMITWSFAWPLFPIVQVKALNMDSFQVAITNVISVLSTLFFQRIIGNLVDKNIKLTMFLGRILLASFPLTYALAQNIYEIYLINIISGITNSISNVAYFTFVVEEAGEKRRAIGIYNLINGTGALVGSMLGGIIYSLLSPLGDVNIARQLLIVTSILRIISSIPFLFL